MTTLKNYIDLPPTVRIQAGRDVLGHVHSGDVLTHSLPKLLRIGAALWFLSYTLQWLSIWASAYKNYERWGLMQAFFALMISIFAAFVMTSITLVRSRHMEALPGDDFVFLRMLAVFCRWLGEMALVFSAGAFLSVSLSFVVLPLLLPFVGEVDPNSLWGVGLRLVTLLAVIASFLLFLLLYTVATGIDLILAIEFNTRADRIARTSRLVESDQTIGGK